MCLQLKSNLSHYVMKRVISTAKNEIWRSILVIQSENFFTINFSFEKVVLGHKHTENMFLLLITAKVEIGSKKNSDKCSENQANHCLFAHRFLEWFSGNWVTFLLDVRKIWVNQPSFFYLSLVRCYKFVSSSCSAIIANENIAKTHKSWRFQAIECEQWQRNTKVLSIRQFHFVIPLAKREKKKNLNEITYMFIAHIPGNWRKMCWNQYFSSLVFLRKSFGLISIFYRAWNHILKHKSWLTLFFGCKIHTRSESRHTHTKDDKFHSWKMAKYAEREKLHKNASWCIFRVSLFQ